MFWYWFFCFTGKDPVPIRCPVAGAFNFTQEGDFPFKTRILGGITKDPRHDVWGRTGQFSCKQNISRLAVCDTGIHIIYLMTIIFSSFKHCKIANSILSSFCFWHFRSKRDHNWWNILLVNRPSRSADWYL